MADLTPTFYLIYGTDEIAVSEAVNQFRSAMGEDTFNISEFEGDSVSVPEILNAVTSYPFLSDKRLVIVRGLLSSLGRSAAAKPILDQLIAGLDDLPDYARLVLVERDAPSDKHPVLKLASSHERGYVKAYNAPKDPVSWIRQRAKREYDAEIEPAAAVALASVVGEDLLRADNELVKLINYVGGERPVTEADVALLTPYVAEANVFDMVDALATGDGKKAMTIMKHSLAEDPRDPGFRLLSMFGTHFQRLLLAREHLTSGGSPNDIASVLGIHPYPAGKIAVQSRAFSVEDLEQIYTRIQRYDYEIKTGRIDISLALDLLVTSLSRA